MKQLVKKILCLSLALLVAITAVPVTAEAAVTYSKNQTLYRTGTGTSYSSIYVSGLTKSQTIKKSSVKSSNTSVAVPWYLEKSTSSYSYKTDYYDSNIKPYSNSDSSYSYYIGLQLKKNGTSTISFKIGSKTYQSKITVKSYVNPLKTVTITGVNGGKNVASKLNKSAYNYDLKLTKTTKNAEVTVKPKSGWKIVSVEVENSDTGDYHRVYNYGTKGVSNATLKLGTLTKGKKVTLRINCQDANGTGLWCYYYINN